MFSASAHRHRPADATGAGEPPGLHPADFQAAYDLPATKGGGQIVAIVDAYDNPDIANDLKTYRAEFGLPAANFTKYNQKGEKKHYPSGNESWGVEEDLDVEMVSASCPNCTIYLIEANSDYTNDLGAAEVEAVKLGAHIVTNSWGGGCSGSCGYGSDFDTPGVVYLASSGDDGYGTSFPSQLGSVVSVGGTSLSTDKGVKRGWTETRLGCVPAAVVRRQPSRRGSTIPAARFRTDNDVAAAANPQEGGAGVRQLRIRRLDRRRRHERIVAAECRDIWPCGQRQLRKSPAKSSGRSRQRKRRERSVGHQQRQRRLVAARPTSAPPGHMSTRPTPGRPDGERLGVSAHTKVPRSGQVAALRTKSRRRAFLGR